MTVSKIRMSNILFAAQSLGLALVATESGKVLVVEPNTGAIIYPASLTGTIICQTLKGVLIVVNESVRRAVVDIFGEDVADEIIKLTCKQLALAGGMKNAAKLLGLQIVLLDSLFEQHGRGTMKLDKGRM